MHAPSYTSSNRHSDIFTGSLLDRHGCKHSEPADGCGLCQLVSHLTPLINRNYDWEKAREGEQCLGAVTS